MHVNIASVRLSAKERERRAAFREPRWPAVVTVLVAVALHFVLPASLRVGPAWLGASVVLVLVLLTIVASYRGHTRANQWLSYALASALTVAQLYGVARLAGNLARPVESAAALLRSGAILWTTNVVTFALWYWRIDAGGPNERDQDQGGGRPSAFLFPQVALLTSAPAGVSSPLVDEARRWRPQFIDYLFLAFNTSTAFSPTDAAVLDRWAKALMMIQSVLSLTTIVVLVARAINTI